MDLAATVSYPSKKSRSMISGYVSSPLSKFDYADRSQDDAWIIIDNKVYDVTSVLSWHPGKIATWMYGKCALRSTIGGAEAIMPYAGKATVDTTNQVYTTTTPCLLLLTVLCSIKE